MSEWQVDIFEDPTVMKLSMRIYRESGPGEYQVVCPYVQDGQITWMITRYQEGEIAPVSLELGRHMIRDGVLNAMADALEKHGAKPKKDVNEATVDAMSHHLSDLQSLVFGSDKILLERSLGREVVDDASV